MRKNTTTNASLLPEPPFNGPCPMPEGWHCRSGWHVRKMNRTDIEKRWPAQKGEESTPGYRKTIDAYHDIYKDQDIAMQRCPVHAARLHTAKLSGFAPNEQERVSDL